MAARAIGVQLRMVRLQTASDLDNAFAALTRDRVDALCVQGYAAPLQNRVAIIAFAAAKRIPAIYLNRGYATEGGLRRWPSVVWGKSGRKLAASCTVRR